MKARNTLKMLLRNGGEVTYCPARCVSGEITQPENALDCLAVPVPHQLYWMWPNGYEDIDRP